MAIEIAEILAKFSETAMKIDGTAIEAARRIAELTVENRET